MSQFSYTAIDAKGKTVRGKMDVASKGEAYRSLEEKQLTPVMVKGLEEGEAGPRSAAARARGVRLNRTQLIHFTEELSDLLDAGVQLQQALGIMHERQQNVGIRRVSQLLREQLRDGATFSAALREASPSFDDLYCNLVAAGEVSGSLTQILRRLASSLTIMQDLQARVVQAMIYPIFMILACIALIIVFMTKLVPQLTSLLTATHQELPAATQMLIALSAWFRLNWWRVLIGFAGGFVLFLAIRAFPAGRLWWDRVKVKFPLFGPVRATHFFASFCQTLGSLVNNGVPLLSALKLMVKATPNQFYKSRLQRVVTTVEAGEAFSTSLRQAGGFPPLLLDVTAIGEQTGHLGKSLEKAAARYDKELNGRIKRLTAMITPVIIVIMAVIVTIVAYSIVTAIFKSVNGIRAAG